MPKDRVLNCLGKDELASHLEERRAGGGQTRSRFTAAAFFRGLSFTGTEAGRSAQEQESGPPPIVSGPAACGPPGTKYYLTCFST